MKDAKSFGTALSTWSVDAVKDSIVYTPPPKTYAANDLSPQQVKVLQKAGVPPIAKQDIQRGLTVAKGAGTTWSGAQGAREGGGEIEVDAADFYKKHPEPDLSDVFDEDPLARTIKSQFNRISLG